MAVESNQKLKILYLMEILRQDTDEDHIVSMAEIISKLEAYGIKAERKGIYSDIETLRQYGMDIVLEKNPTGYRLDSREFELSQLKMLVDSVQSSRFLSTKNSNELIKLLESFTSRHKASELQREVYVADRVKSANENAANNVDYIHKAIFNNSQIKFKYLEWNMKKELEAKKNGDFYIVSPISLVWSEGNYYLIAFDEKDKKVKHYRVDKMKTISLTGDKRNLSSENKQFNMAVFSKKTFGMFGGEETSVDVIFPKKLIGVVIDRFGVDTPIIPIEDKQFKAILKVVVSNQFFGWITGLGEGVVIAGPEKTKKEYKKFLKGILKEYKQ